MKLCNGYEIQKDSMSAFFRSAGRHCTGTAQSQSLSSAAVSDSRPWVKYMILLYAVLFLSSDSRCTDGCTAADEQQGNPQSKVACIAGLGTLIGCSRLGTGRLFLKSSNRIFDSLCHLDRKSTRVNSSHCD